MTRKASRKAPPARKTAATKKRSEAEKSPSEKARSREKQAGLYEKAMKLFHSGQFAKALDLFVFASSGPVLEMAHSARVHKMVCERRMASGEVELPTAEDHYNYAIALINRSEPGQALSHLEQALEEMQNADYVHYAMAICLGQMDEVDRAAEHLSRAIAIQPRNRSAARNDPDFKRFASAPPIKKILRPDAAD